MIAPTSAAVDAKRTAGSKPFKLNCSLTPVNPVIQQLEISHLKNYEI